MPVDEYQTLPELPPTKKPVPVWTYDRNKAVTPKPVLSGSLPAAKLHCRPQMLGLPGLARREMGYFV